MDLAVLIANSNLALSAGMNSPTSSSFVKIGFHVRFSPPRCPALCQMNPALHLLSSANAIVGLVSNVRGEGGIETRVRKIGVQILSGSGYQAQF